MNKEALNKENVRLRWGIIEVFMVFAGVMGTGMLFNLYADRIMVKFTQWGLPVSDLSFFILSFLLQFAATVLLVLLFTVWLNRATLRELGLRPVSRDKLIKYGLMGGLLLLTLVTLLGALISYLQPQIKPQLFEEMLRSAGGNTGFIIMFVIGSIMAPFVEELYYRGMIYPVCKKYLGPWGGALVAGTLFGLAHWDFWRTLPLAVGGAILCYMYEKTGSIWVSMLAHGVWNGVMSVIVYFSVIQF